MIEYAHYFFSFIRPRFLDDFPRIVSVLISSWDFYFWLIFSIVIRFSLPDIALWLSIIRNPLKIRDPFYPSQSPYPGKPLVTVLIAGRNVVDTIAPTIRSVFSSGYENIEVIFVDDGSTDNSVHHARTLWKNSRVRVFGAGIHNGKASSINIGLNMVNGEFTFILDADSELQFGAIDILLAQFNSANVGGVAANLRVRNSAENILTQLQECEYAMNVSIARLWRAKLGLSTILPGAGAMFRTQILKDLGGFDTGLGDDTDMTIKLRKGRWRIGFAPNAIVWTDVPNTLSWLLKQRSRWSRNMVKIRLHKQLDIGNPFRYGVVNTLLLSDLLITRVILPILGFGGVIYYSLREPLGTPILITGLYWMVIFFLTLRLLIANDIARTPMLSRLWLFFIYPFYRLPIRIVETFSILRELFGIRKWHPYVPKKIWKQIPHW